MSIKKPSTPAPLDFGILLNVAFGAFKSALHAHLARAGYGDIGTSFGYVLRTLDPHPQGLSLKELAAALGVTPQGTLKIVDDMVGKAYVLRSADPDDSRVKRLRVAPRGLALLKEARKFHRAFESSLADATGSEAVARTRGVLELLAGTASVGPSIRMQLL